MVAGKERKIMGKSGKKKKKGRGGQVRRRRIMRIYIYIDGFASKCSVAKSTTPIMN